MDKYESLKRAKPIRPLNAQAAAFVPEMIAAFEKRKKECLTKRTEEFYQECINTLNKCPQQFSSIIYNNYRYREDLTIPMRFALHIGQKLKELQLKRVFVED